MEDSMLDEQVVTKFVSDEETLRDTVKELDLREAQIVYVNTHARFFSNTADVEANRECEAARKRLFYLFTDGCEDAAWVLKAWNQYRRRLCYHHRADS